MDLVLGPSAEIKLIRNHFYADFFFQWKFTRPFKILYYPKKSVLSLCVCVRVCVCVCVRSMNVEKDLFYQKTQVCYFKFKVAVMDLC